MYRLSKLYGAKAERKRVLKGRPAQAGTRYVLDPKPGELALGRMKPREIGVEVRTGWLCKTFG